MKLARSHLGPLALILAVLGGPLAAACSAPPGGSIGAGDQEQNANGDDDDGTKSSTLPTNPANTNGNQTGTQNTPGAGTGTTPSPTPPPSDVDASATPPPSGGTCEATADMWACFDCCDAAHPGGWEVAAQAFDSCVCTQACAAACGSTYCAGAEPNAACIQCLDNDTQQCEAAADAACAGDANCTATDACAQASQCETKPEQ